MLKKMLNKDLILTGNKQTNKKQCAWLICQQHICCLGSQEFASSNNTITGNMGK